MLNGDAVPPADHRTTRRIAVLFGAGPDLGQDRAPAVGAQHARAEVEHLRARPGGAVRWAASSITPERNPMAGTASMMGSSDFVAAALLDVADDLDDDALLDALGGFAERHGPVGDGISLERSSLLVGWYHHLRERPLPLGAEPLQALVALRGSAGLSNEEFRRRWLVLGGVNARNHPTCSTYGQLHADVALTAAALERCGLGSGPFAGLALEVFPTLDDLHAGHAYAKAPSSLDGSPVAGEHLMALLGEVLDFGSAATLLAAPAPDAGT